MQAQDVNLTNCDREPIHQLGCIQGFGALVAVNSDWIVAHRSTNVEAIFGRAATSPSARTSRAASHRRHWPSCVVPRPG